MIKPGRKGYIIAYDEQNAVAIGNAVTTTSHNAFGQRCPDNKNRQLRMWKRLEACRRYAKKLSGDVRVEEIFPSDEELIHELTFQMRVDEAMLRTLFDCSHRTIWEDE